MNTALAIIIGALWGGACGVGKYLLLWRPLFKAADRGEASSQSRVGLNSGLSLLLDLPVLLLPYLLRQRLPFSLAPCLIAAAVALSVCGRWPLLLRVRRMQRAQAGGERSARGGTEQEG